MPESTPLSPANDSGGTVPLWVWWFFVLQFGLFLVSLPFLQRVRGGFPSVEEEVSDSIAVGSLLVQPMLIGCWAGWSPLRLVRSAAVSLAATILLGVCFTFGDATALIMAVSLVATWAVFFKMVRFVTGLALVGRAHVFTQASRTKLRLIHLFGVTTAVAAATAWVALCDSDWQRVIYWSPYLGHYVALMLPALACVALVLSGRRWFALALFLFPGLVLFSVGLVDGAAPSSYLALDRLDPETLSIVVGSCLNAVLSALLLRAGGYRLDISC